MGAPWPTRNPTAAEATRALGSLLIAAVNAGVRVAAAETARSVEAALHEEGIERHFLVQFDELE